MKARLPFLPIIPNVPTNTGHIYSNEVIEEVFRQIRSRLPWLGVLAFPSSGKTSIAESTHQTLSVERIGVDAFGDVEIFPMTSAGGMVAEFLKAGLPLYLAPRLLGTKRPSGEIDLTGLKVAGLDIAIPDGPVASALDLIARGIFSGD